jgi:5-methylthioadenosine/S-adenosylhomocysteine deaminase
MGAAAELQPALREHLGVATVIRGATLLTMAPNGGDEPFVGDILIEGDSISAVGVDLEAPLDAITIDGRDQLVMPGLINAHLHTGETFFKGRYDNLPLELWMLYAYPIRRGAPIGERLLYLRCMLSAIESLKNGVTTIVDDFFDPPEPSLDRLSVVFSAYDDAGIRANVSNNVMDKKVLDTMPFLRELVPAELQAQADATPISIGAYMDYCEAAFASLHGRAGRLRYMIAPSAPQRCTAEMMIACNDMAVRHGVPLHTHILETKTQAVTGPEFYGKTLIRYMHDIGVLNRGVTIAHSIWVTDEDMALMGAAGCSIAHNVISNQKLGAGIAPVRRLLDAGVNVALGTDGLCSNDTARMFDIIHAAGLIHSVATPDYSKWLSAAEVLKMATLDGARSALIDDHTGSLEAGKRADLIVLKINGINFTPLNDVRNHLVYCENGQSIEMVMVSGEVVVRDNRLTRIDEDAILAEIRETVPAYLTEHAADEALNRAFEPYFFEMHRRATIRDIGINRYAGDMSMWPGQNRPAIGD